MRTIDERPGQQDGCLGALRFSSPFEATAARALPLLLVRGGRRDGFGGPGHAADDRSLTLRSGGTGLGLAIADRIAAAHQAQLTIESEAGKGTAVEVGFGSGGIGP